MACIVEPSMVRKYTSDLGGFLPAGGKRILQKRGLTM